MNFHVITYMLDLPSSSRVHSVVHVSLLKPYFGTQLHEDFCPLPSHKKLYFEAYLSKVNQTEEYKQEEENVIRFTSFKTNGSACGGSAPKQEKETILDLTSKINKIIDGVKVGNRYFKGEKNTNVNVSSQEKKDFTSLQVHVHQLDSTKSM